MSWISKLNETYENLYKLDFEKRRGLLPISHSTQKAHLELTIDADGNFVKCEFVQDVVGKEKNRSETLIPVTEKSANRTNHPVPHPLCDKLIYLAGDYAKYNKQDKKNKGNPYEDYLAQIRNWENSDYSTPKVTAIKKYIEKGNLIEDLIKADVFSVDNSGYFTKKWEKCDIKISTGTQEEAFIRVRVVGDNSCNSAVWQDTVLQDNFSKYYEHMHNEKGFCYVTGEEIYCSENHPSKIRSSADKAKLISSNDKINFTYIGRFEDANEAVMVGYKTSQKAHNALKYIISKQGEKIGGKVFVLWGTQSEIVPKLNADTEDLLFDDEDTSQYEDIKTEYAIKFNKAIAGYKANIDFDTNYCLIGLDAASTGRMCIIFYREYKGHFVNELLNRIKKWHETASWLHRYKFVNKERKTFYGAPSPKDIAICAFGIEHGDFINAKENIAAKAVERLIPCISDGKKIPCDIVKSLVRKCYMPQNYSKEYNWNKVLTITCSVYKKYSYDYKKV